MSSQGGLPDGVIHLGPGENRRPGHVVVKAGGADTAGAYALRETIAEPGFRVAPHRHSGVDEAWFVIEGELAYLVERDVVVVPSGGFIFVPRGVTHAFANRGSSAARFLVIFSPPGFEDMFEELLTLRADGRSTPEKVATIRRRYATEDVHVAPGVWE